MKKSKPTTALNFKFRLPTLLLTFSCYLLFTISSSSYGQTKISNTNFNIKSKIVEATDSNFKNIEISWDFSNSASKTPTNLNIEIQPINDCWNKLNGKNRSDMFLKTFKNLTDNPTGNLLLSLREYNTKCFKWRAKTINTNTRHEQYTDWQFSSFL